LRAFRRIALAPGESKTVRFELSEKDLSVLDAQLQRHIVPGEHRVLVGGSSASGLRGTLTVAN
jgi:beta-glucosidase